MNGSRRNVQDVYTKTLNQFQINYFHHLIWENLHLDQVNEILKNLLLLLSKSKAHNFIQNLSCLLLMKKTYEKNEKKQPYKNFEQYCNQK